MLWHHHYHLLLPTLLHMHAADLQAAHTAQQLALCSGLMAAAVLALGWSLPTTSSKISSLHCSTWGVSFQCIGQRCFCALNLDVKSDVYAVTVLSMLSTQLPSVQWRVMR